MLIYKVFRVDEWDELQARGSSSGAPVDRDDGYVHFSTRDQLRVTLSKHFASDDRLTLLACNADRMGPALKWEPSRGGAAFPHLYRDLTLEDVVWSRPINLLDGTHQTGPLE